MDMVYFQISIWQVNDNLTANRKLTTPTLPIENPPRHAAGMKLPILHRLYYPCFTR